MKRIVQKSISLTLILLVLAGCFLPGISHAVENVSMRIGYKLDGVTSVSKGMPFGATFYFNFEEESISSPKEAPKVSVAASGVALSKKSFELAPFSLRVSDTGSSEEPFPSGTTYELYIPEQYMTYTGKSPATFKFTITWKSGSESYRAYGQKTVTECVVSDAEPEPEQPQAKPGLLLEGYSVSDKDIREGKQFELTLNVRNNSQVECRNVNVVLPSLESITVNGGLNAQTIASLPAGGAASVKFSMLCAPSMATGNVPIAVSLFGEDVEERTYQAYVFVTGTADQKEEEPPVSEAPQELKPIIILESYDYGGEAVRGGKEFDLTMNFRNTSRTLSIDNALIKVSAVTNDAGAGAAFTPANSSSTFYIESIAPGQSAQETITLLPKADAEPNSYSMQVTFDYVYGKDHTSATDSVTFSIPLTQEDRFTVTLGEIYGPVMVGDSVSLSANYVNQGKSTIYNLSVAVEGNFTALDGSTSYIGNVQSGTGDYVDLSVSPNEPGLMEGKMIFTYEDSTGAQKTAEQSFTCDVVESFSDPVIDPGIEDPMMDPSAEEDQGLPVWAIALIAVGGAAVLVVLIVLIRKHRKAKRERFLEELESGEGEPAPFEPEQPAAEQPQEEGEQP